jgi:hypothetical protein
MQEGFFEFVELIDHSGHHDFRRLLGIVIEDKDIKSQDPSLVVGILSSNVNYFSSLDLDHVQLIMLQFILVFVRKDLDLLQNTRLLSQLIELRCRLLDLQDCTWVALVSKLDLPSILFLLFVIDVRMLCGKLDMSIIELILILNIKEVLDQ